MIGLMVILENMKSAASDVYKRQVGFLWRRKLQHFQDIFRFKTKEKKSNVVENDTIPVVTQPTKEVK